MSTSLSIDEKLIHLSEEAAEVIQAASKCLRFGYDIDHGTGYGNNRKMLSKEIGDLLALVDALDLDWDEVESTRKSKMTKILKYKTNFPKNAIRMPLGRPEKPVGEFK